MRFSVVRVVYPRTNSVTILTYKVLRPCFTPQEKFRNGYRAVRNPNALRALSRNHASQAEDARRSGRQAKRVASITVASYASAPLGAPPVVRMASPRPIAKHTNKHERFASAIQAPSPSCLPKPPSSWTRAAPPTSSYAQLTSPLSPPPITLQRSDVVQKQLQGNLLFSMLGSGHPAPTMHLQSWP